MGRWLPRYDSLNLGPVLHQTPTGNEHSFAVSVSSNAANVSAAFLYLARDQIPFAVSVALTRTAQDAYKGLRKGVALGNNQFFTIRNMRVEQGIRMQAARKADWPHPYAVVGDKDAFMVLHVTGGEKKSRAGHARVAVPFDILASKRTAAGSIIARKKPIPLRHRPDVFLNPEGGDEVIIQRLPKAGGRSRNKALTSGPMANLRGIVTYWRLIDHANIKRRWPFDTIATKIVQDGYAEHFKRELGIAVLTAKGKAGALSPGGLKASYSSARAAAMRIPNGFGAR